MRHNQDRRHATPLEYESSAEPAPLVVDDFASLRRAEDEHMADDGEQRLWITLLSVLAGVAIYVAFWFGMLRLHG